MHLQVVDMRDLRTYYMKQDDFFEAFKLGGDQVQAGGGGRAQPPAMLKVKDFPPTAHFAEVLPRHWQVNKIFRFSSSKPGSSDTCPNTDIWRAAHGLHHPTKN